MNWFLALVLVPILTGLVVGFISPKINPAIDKLLGRQKSAITSARRERAHRLTEGPPGKVIAYFMRPVLLALGSFLLASTLLLVSVVLAVNGESWGGYMIASAVLFMVAAGTVGWAWQTAKQISDLASDTVSAAGNLTQPGEPAHARRADEQIRISKAKM